MIMQRTLTSNKHKGTTTQVAPKVGTLNLLVSIMLQGYNKGVWPPAYIYIIYVHWNEEILPTTYFLQTCIIQPLKHLHAYLLEVLFFSLIHLASAQAIQCVIPKFNTIQNTCFTLLERTKISYWILGFHPWIVQGP